MKNTVTLCMLAVLCFSTMKAADVRSNAGGKSALWSLGSTWSGGAVPGAADLVTIADGDTITIDIDATVAGLTVGTSAGAVFQFPKSAKANLTVNGDILVLPGSVFKAQTSTVSGVEMLNTCTLTGNFTSTGAAILDCRVGTAGSTMGIINFILTGSTNTIFTTNPLYNSGTNELNGMTVNKSGTAKVILGSNISFAGGSSSSLASTSIVTLINGVVETGKYIFIHNSTTGANITGASSKSYISGALARGMSSSAGANKDFPVGDAGGYRPIKIRTTTGGNVTGHYVVARVVSGNANTGSSTFAGGIDKVSGVRYYEISYGADIAGAPTSMTFDKFVPMYGTDDGVGVGNTDLRLAISTNKRATWTGFGQSVQDTTFQRDTVMTADSLATPLTIDSTQTFAIALARATGTTTNTLINTGNAVTEVSAVPAAFSLEQNYPNPFNPSTTIRFSLASTGLVRLTIYDLLGREVATVVNEFMRSGSYEVQWNASQLPSGMYLYRLVAGSSSSVKKLTLIK